MAETQMQTTQTSPTLQRAASVNSYDATDNTIEVVWAAGAPVRRYSARDGTYYDEALVMTSAACRLARMNAGAPFLDSHNSTNLDTVLGAVVPGTAKIEGGRGVATVKLSRAPEDAATVSKIRDGIIRNISVGYVSHRVEKKEPGKDGIAEWRVLDWEPMEISAVPIPADPDAQVRAAGEPELPAGYERVAIHGGGHETVHRDTRIREVAQRLGRAEFGELHIRAGTSIPDFHRALVDNLANQDSNSMTTNTNIRATVGTEAFEKRAPLIQSAILNRADSSQPLIPGAEAYRGFTLLEMARSHLDTIGVRTHGMTRQELATAALQQRSGYMSSSDFPVILGNVINTTLRAGYEAYGQTFRPLVHETTVPDFKPVTLAQIGSEGGFNKINEHGEYSRGYLIEGKESYRLCTYGKIIAVTRQALINDDMNAFGRIPHLLGQQAAQLESDLVWYQILSNPVMGDGVTLFHATHKNLAAVAKKLTATDAITALGAARSTMVKQTGLDGKTVLNVRPSFLMVSAEAQTAAEQMLRSTFYPDDAAKTPTSTMKALQIIMEPRLDNGINNPAIGPAIAGSADAWYLAAAPTQLDTIELAYLDGNRGVYTETRQGFDVDGVEVKARLDVAAKVVDWRGFYKNSGV